MKRIAFTNIQLFIYLFLVVLLASCKTAKLSDAEEKHRIGEYHKAAEIYRKVYTKTKPDKRDLRGYIAFRMADCNRRIGNIGRATSAYMNAIRYDYPDSTVYLYLGQTLHKSGRYADAISYYTEYLNYVPDDFLALNGIKGCEIAPEMRDNPTVYEVKRVELFNSNYGEFSPMFNGKEAEELYFTSSRGRIPKDSVNAITGVKDNNFFVVKKNEHGIWQKPEELEDPVNTEFDEGTPSFTADGNTMYYTYCAHDPLSSKTAEIFMSSRSGAQWGAGTKVTLLKDTITPLGHPSISPDGKYLYFVSETVGGMGGKDIYRARKVSEGNFTAMENLGPDINTPGDEMFPFVRDSVTLYFSSNGHVGMGGLDLFKATLDSTGRWQVVNLGAPINSMGDDFGMTFELDKEKGYFSSNRNDARGFDHLYSFERPVFTVFIEGMVFDNEEYPIPEATVHIVGRDGLNAKAITKPDGTYRIELERDIRYVMMAGASGFLNQNFELKTGPEEQNETYYVDFFLSPIDKPVVVENIFYDFDKATLRPESKEALDGLIKILNDNPNATIELGAHTDRKGSVEYNESLALRRAQSVVDYLIEAGVDAGRLEAKGYGKSTPKTITKKMAEAYEFLTEGEVLNEELVNVLTPEQQEIADQFNRRTEFQVTGLNFDL